MNVHLYPSPMTHETRIHRICSTLSRAGMFDRVIAVGIDRPGLPERETNGMFEVHRVPRSVVPGPAVVRKAWQTLSWTWRTARAYWRERITCVNSHSLATLPLAWVLSVRHGALLIYDTHELETETVASRGVQGAIYRILERLFIFRVDATFCVSGAISRWYADRYGIAAPLVIRNVPAAAPLNTAEHSGLRDIFGIPPDELLFLYLGLIGPGRRIEQLLRVFENLDDSRHIVFMGYGPLEPMVKEAAARRANVHFHHAVPPDEVPRYAASADVGICGGENVCLSYYLSLPNKLFEYVRAGLPIMVPDWPEMRSIVREHDCGWVVGETQDSWGSAIGSLTRAEVDRVAAASRAVSARFSWATEEERLLSAYRHLVAEREPVSA